MRFGAQTLGFYKKAYDLFALSMTQTTAPLTNVAVAALSRFRPNSIQYRQSLLGALAVTSFVGMGAGADLTRLRPGRDSRADGPGVAPRPPVHLLRPRNRHHAGLYTTHGWIHLSIGKADRWLRWSILEYVVTALLFVLGLHWGPEGVRR